MMAPDTAIEARVRLLLDSEQIRDVILRYCRAVDRCDWDLARSCYHPDALDDHGIFTGQGHKFIDFLETFVPSFAESTQHFVTTTSVEVLGSVAFGESYCVGYHRISRGGTTGMADVPIAARCVDRFERRSAEWRIAHRRLVFEWTRLDPVVEYELPPGAVVGTRDLNDPSRAGFRVDVGGMAMNQDDREADFDVAKAIDILDSKQEIRDVIARFCRGVDRFDWDLVRSCYHDDAVDHHGIFDGGVEGFIEFGQGFLPSWTERTMHSIGNCLIELDGDFAFAETYIVGYHRLAELGDDGKPVDTTVAGRYVDRFERRDGRWLIADRTFVFDWSRVDPLVEDYEAPPGAVRGVRDRSDPSYSR
jgi:ketosteroid isomerase-like protein